MADQGDVFKKRGNEHFAHGNFEDAVAEYSTAIIRNPSNAIYYTNRGLTYLKLQKYENAAQDCERACQLDEKNVKAHYFLGQALAHLERLDKAVTILKEGYTLSVAQKSPFAADLCTLILSTRRKRWEAQEKRRIAGRNQLLTRLTSLADDERSRKMHALGTSATEDALDQIAYDHDQLVGDVQLLFAQADENLKVRNVPEAFIDKISFNVMQDPVATPSGVSFERTHIVAHLQMVGQFDPFTREPLTEASLIPNLSLKEAIEEWLKENEWATDY